MSRLDQAVSDLPHRFVGPGGACAVIRNGDVIIRHAWGWADAEHRILFTPRTLFRICSITKQFTCAAALAVVQNIAELDAAVRAYLLAFIEPACVFRRIADTDSDASRTVIPINPGQP